MRRSRRARKRHPVYFFYAILVFALIVAIALALSADPEGEATRFAQLDSHNLPSDLRIADMVSLPEGSLPQNSRCWLPVDAPAVGSDGYLYQTWVLVAGCGNQ